MAIIGEPLVEVDGIDAVASTARRRSRLKKWTLGAGAAIAGTAFAAGAVFGSHGLDLTSSGSQGTIGGAVFRQADFTESSLGTGVINSFLRVQNSPVEEGFNTDNGTPFDAKAGNFTKSILLSDVPEVEIGGTMYREVWLDINEANNTSPSLISLDEYQVYISSDGMLAEADYVHAGPTLDGASPVYDLDGLADRYVLLDYSLGAGSGNDGDMVTYLPSSLFASYPDCNFGSSTCGEYFYLYALFGLNEGADGHDPNQETDATAEAGGEEFFVINRPVLEVTKTADLDFTRTFDWEIDKSVDPDAHTGFTGDSFNSTYEVTVTKDDGTDSAKTVSGTVTVTNVGDVDADIESLVDNLDGYGEIPLDCDVAVPGVLEAGDSINCTYAVAVGDSYVAGNNAATVTIEELLGANATFEAIVPVSENAPTLVNDDIDVFDDFGNDGNDRILGEGVSTTTTFPTYQQSFDCTELNSSFEGTTTNYPNTASTSLGDSSQADVDVTCYEIGVSKSGNATRAVDYDWSVTKTATPELIQLFDGESSSVEWTIEVVKSDAETTSQTLGGTITIVNPNPNDSADVTVTDTYPGATIGVDCSDDPGDQNTATVPADGQVVCTYTGHSFVGDLADGTNTATVNRNGVELTATADIVVQETVTDDCVDVSDISELGGGFAATETCESLTVVDGDDPSFSEDVFCGEDEGLWENTVMITGDADDPSDNSATADVAVECYQLTVEKTAQAARAVDYEWSVNKTADPTALELFYGESGTIDWTVEVTKSDRIIDSQSLTGTITIDNPHPTADAIVSVIDVYPGATIGVNCPSATVPAGGQLVCTYEATSIVGELADGTNTATVGHISSPAPATAPVVVDETVTDDCIGLTDDLAPDGTFPAEICDSMTVSGGDAFTYNTMPTCGKDDFTVTNLAAIVGDHDTPGDNEADASTDITCIKLDIEKDVTPHFTRTYQYSITKDAQLPGDGVIDLNFGESYIVTWDIVLSEEGISDSAFNIDTVVTVTNPGTRDAVGVTIVDGIAVVALTCDWGVPGTVPAGVTVTCTSIGDGVGADVLSNTASATAYGVEHDSSTASWAFDTPDTEVNKTVNVQDAFGPADDDLTSRLQPQPTTYTYGDEADGTREWTLMTLVSTDAGDNPDLLIGCGRTVVENDVVLLGDGGIVLGEDTALAPVDVLCGSACTLTQGYWRTHSAAGPKGWHDNYLAGEGDWKHRDETWNSLGDVDGDGVFEYENEEFFGSGMTWWQVQWEAPQGHFYFNLAHQWIATHLNVWQEANEAFGGDWNAAFATLPGEVQDAYDDAVVFFSKPSTDPYGRLKGKDKKDITGWHGKLASFNEGAYPGWPHCDENSEAEVVKFGQLAGLL